MSNNNFELVKSLNAKVNLITLLQNNGLELRKNGKLYKALCPFHAEKTPSFTVNPNTQHYYCYGCGAHGYAKDFLEANLKMSSIEAIQYLAELTHTSLDNTTISQLRYEISQAEKTREILRITADFYANQLHDVKHDSDTKRLAFEFLIEQRGFELKTAKQCNIGLSESKNALVEFFKKQHRDYTDDDLIKAGIANLRNNGQLLDHFHGKRLIFPIYDSRGRVVMLSGRSIDNAEPKYLHTPHSKNKILYGINFLPKNFDKLIVVEGNFDVMRGVAQNLPVVGILGGKCSDHQLQRLLELSRYGEKPIYLCLDSDHAGKKATLETVKLGFKQIQHSGGLIKVIDLPSDNGQKTDFDSFFKDATTEEFNGLADSSLEASLFFKREFLKEHSPENFDAQLPEFKVTLKKKLETELKYLDNDKFKSDLTNLCLDIPTKYEVTQEAESKVDVVFWRESVKSDNPVLSIDVLELLNFFQQNGFGRYWLKDSTGQDIQSILVRLKNQIVTEVSVEQMRDFVYDYVRNLNNSITESFTKDDLKLLLVRQTGTHFCESRLKWLDAHNLDFHKDTEKSTFFYYKNCFVEVRADTITAHNYSKLQGVIWKRQIINRDFNKLSDSEYQKGIFAQFQRNICRARGAEFDEEGDHGNRLKSLQCAIGYMLHRFRTGTRIPAVIFNDERISDEPKGRSGKGLTCKGISHMRPTVEIDGKKFDPSYQHNFQNVRRDTGVILFDDLDKKFDMESLFSILSNGITINIKGESNPIVIPFEESPKIMMTTNYVASGDSDSHAARKWEIVASPYYDVDFTPEVEFGLRLFEGFDATEWSRFDNYMMLCAKKYLQHGVYKHISENLAIRKLIQATNADFIDFANDLERNTEHDKSETLKRFKEEYPDYERIQQRTFTAWLHKYALYTQGIRFDERKSNGKALFSFVKLSRLDKN